MPHVKHFGTIGGDFLTFQLQPVVAPQVSPLRHFPLRTRVKFPHSPQASPVKPFSRAWLRFSATAARSAGVVHSSPPSSASTSRSRSPLSAVAGCGAPPCTSINLSALERTKPRDTNFVVPPAPCGGRL